MSPVATLLWAILIVGGITALATAGGLIVRRWVAVEVLERHNEVAGFIYAVIGVVYAVLLGFTAILSGKGTTKHKRKSKRRRMNSETCSEMPKFFQMRSGESWKLACAPMPAS